LGTGTQRLDFAESHRSSKDECHQNKTWRRSVGPAASAPARRFMCASVSGETTIFTHPSEMAAGRG